MALSPRSRSILFERLSTIVGDEAAIEDLLQQFPMHDGPHRSARTVRPMSSDELQRSLRALRIKSTAVLAIWGVLLLALAVALR